MAKTSTSKKSAVESEVIDASITTVGSASVEDLESSQNIEVLDEEAEGLLDKARDIRDKMESSYFDLSEVLYKIAKEELYSLRGFDNFHEYVEDEENGLNIKKRTAQYLVQIYEFILKLQESKLLKEVDELKTLGWTKVKEIASVANVDNIEYWIETAKKNSVRDLIEIRKDFMRDIEGDDEGEKKKEKDAKTNWSVKLHNETLAALSTALDLAEKKSGKKDKESLIEILSSSFLASESDDINERLNNLEVSESIRIVAIKDGDIVYGAEVFGELGLSSDEGESHEEITESEPVEEDTSDIAF